MVSNTSPAARPVKVPGKDHPLTIARTTLDLSRRLMAMTKPEQHKALSQRA